MWGEQFCAIVMQLRFGISEVTHPKNEIMDPPI